MFSVVLCLCLPVKHHHNLRDSLIFLDYFIIMPKCCAFKCDNKGAHRFPTDEERRKVWIKALRQQNWKPSSSARLCSAHFRPDDFYGESTYTGLEHQRRNLKKAAVPSVFLFSKHKGPKSRRQIRYEARSMRISESNPSTSFAIEPEVDNVQIPDVGCEINIKESLKENLDVTQTKKSSVSVSEKSTQINIEYIYGSVGRFQNNDKAILFYTGFESYDKFLLVYLTLSRGTTYIQYFSHHILNMSYEDQFFLTLMKLRRNKSIFELSIFFGIPRSTVSNIFITWVNFMYQMWNKLNIWPSRGLVNFYMPESFKKYDKTVRVILDGTEFPVQKSGNKNSNTLKVLVGATPGGLLSFCSPAYGGSTSDRQIIERSDLLTMCESGDTVLADRSLNVQDIFISKNVKVNIPAFLKGKSQLPGLTVLHDRASKRLHIERLIGLTKAYKILKSDLDHSYVPLASKIFYVCLMCYNFKEGIVN